MACFSSHESFRKAGTSGKFKNAMSDRSTLYEGRGFNSILGIKNYILLFRVVNLFADVGHVFKANEYIEVHELIYISGCSFILK